MTPPITWMRHGANRDGVYLPGAHPRNSSPLTVGGRIQVAQTASEMYQSDMQPAIIVPSTILRARQTSRIVGNILQIPVARPVATFAEWRPPTCALGRTPAQYTPAYAAWREQREIHTDTTLPGGESLDEFARRAEEAISTAHTLAEQHGSVLIVSHHLLIGAVAAIYRGYETAGEIFRQARAFPIQTAGLWIPTQEGSR